MSQQRPSSPRAVMTSSITSRDILLLTLMTWLVFHKANGAELKARTVTPFLAQIRDTHSLRSMGITAPQEPTGTEQNSPPQRDSRSTGETSNRKKKKSNSTSARSQSTSESRESPVLISTPSFTLAGRSDVNALPTSETDEASKEAISCACAVSTPESEVTVARSNNVTEQTYGTTARSNDVIQPQPHGVLPQSDFVITSQADDVASQTERDNATRFPEKNSINNVISSSKSKQQTDPKGSTDTADQCCDLSTDPLSAGIPDATGRPPLKPSTKKTPSRQPTVSKETYDRLYDALTQIFVYYELASIILTTTSAAIYALPSMRCGATAYYLVALNAADTLTGLMVVVRNAWILAGDTSSKAFNYFTTFGVTYLSVSSRRMVYCLFMLLSSERFFVIAFPLKARHAKIIRYPKVCVGVIAVCLLAYHVYLPLKFTVVPSAKGRGFATRYSQRYRENRESFHHVSNGAKLMFSYLPLSVCLALSVALKVALQRHTAARKALTEPSFASSSISSSSCNPPNAPPAAKPSRTSSAESQLARTIWLSTLMFTLLSLPSNTVQIVSAYHPDFSSEGLERRLYILVRRFAAVALTSTRFTNFLAYLCLSTSFRNNLLRGLFCRRNPRPARGVSGINESAMTRSRPTASTSLNSTS